MPNQLRHNNLSIKLLFLFPALPGVQLFLLPTVISSTIPSLQTIQSPCINALNTSSLLTASTSSDPASRGFRGLTTTDGGTFGTIVIFALNLRSGEVSSILGRVVLDSDKADLRGFVAAIDFVCEYVERTNFHVSPPFTPRLLAHSYRSYLDTKIQPPPSPRRKSTCHFPRTPRGSRSNLQRVCPVSVSTMRDLRTACDWRFRIGLMRGRGVSLVGETGWEDVAGNSR